MDIVESRLTSLAHGGGCGCKLAPSVLQDLLAGLPQLQAFPNLLVGTETADDAAVYRLTDDLALVATTDFFMPIVDDPYDFGRIAATNALSDVYAMGGTPVLALALLGMPLGKIATGTVQQILAGGAAVCRDAGIAVAGGHSIDSLEPIYGLVALGTVHPNRVLRNSGAEAGDVLLLTKGLGIGIFSAALKQGQLGDRNYKVMIQSATQLNAVGRTLASVADVHAMTDVTGFGLLGHTLEMCRASHLRACIHWSGVPILQGAAELAASGFATGAADRNWLSYSAAVAVPAVLPDWQRALLCDPQTSGGLLIAVAPGSVARVQAILASSGFTEASVIGALHAGAAGIDVD